VTDLYGDIPILEAIKATEGNLKPAFDKQKTYTLKILSDLEQANTLLDPSKADLWW
jgi:hypothetical protein